MQEKLTLKEHFVSSNVTELFYFVDEFGKKFGFENRHLTQLREKRPTREPGLCNSEITAIWLLYFESKLKTFKDFYLNYLPGFKPEFPKMPSYERFVILKQRVLGYLNSLLNSILESDEYCYFVDSTEMSVCRRTRASRNKVFGRKASLGKSSKGFFFGFKLHIVVNRSGELCGVSLSRGNVDDRVPVPKITSRLSGLLVGDKGYISKKLFKQLMDKGLKLITDLKKGMKDGLRNMQESLALKKRSIVETVFSVLKGCLELVHSRHRSPINFLGHVFATLISYQMRKKKPTVAAKAA